jgi:hypothetical protein
LKRKSNQLFIKAVFSVDDAANNSSALVVKLEFALYTLIEPISNIGMMDRAKNQNKSLFFKELFCINSVCLFINYFFIKSGIGKGISYKGSGI